MATFPHPCGEELERAVTAGVDPATVIPDDFVIVRGGIQPIPPAGQPFSVSAGPTLAAAACAVPHGKLTHTTAGAIRAAGGSVVWVPQQFPSGIMNLQHAHITESGNSTFSTLIPNPVDKGDRIA